MKPQMLRRARLFLLIVPLVLGSLYLRSIVSWRPKLLLIDKGNVQSLAFSRDGQNLLVMQRQLTSLDATHNYVVRWKHKTDSSLAQFFASDSRVFLNWRENGSGGSEALDAQKGTVIWEKREYIYDIISPDGKWLATYEALWGPIPDHDNPYIVYGAIAVPVAQKVSKIKGLLQKSDNGKDTVVAALAFSPDANLLAIANSVTGSSGTRARLNFYDTKTWKLVCVRPDIKWPPTAGNDSCEAMLRWSRDGRFLLSVWTVTPLTAPTYSAEKVCFSVWRASDGKKLASTSLQKFSPRFPFLYGRFFPGNAEVQNDGRVLAVGNNGHVYLDKVAKLNSMAYQPIVLPSETVTAATVSPDGSYLAVGTRGGKVFRQRLK